jgi:hypothetical protein
MAAMARDLQQRCANLETRRGISEDKPRGGDGAKEKAGHGALLRNCVDPNIFPNDWIYFSLAGRRPLLNVRVPPETWTTRLSPHG